MMIAMVITFTATDVLTGTGQGATERQCVDAAESECGVRQAQYVDLPSACLTENNNLISAVDPSKVGELNGQGTCTFGPNGDTSGCEYSCN
jgi:hypothetical protein